MIKLQGENLKITQPDYFPQGLGVSTSGREEDSGAVLAFSSTKIASLFFQYEVEVFLRVLSRNTCPLDFHNTYTNCHVNFHPCIPYERVYE